MKKTQSKTFCSLYSRDFSMYNVMPSVVVAPKNSKEVKDAIDFARSNNLSIHARGSGTSTMGQSLGPGLVIDFTRYMNRLIKVGNDFVIVQPGMLYGRLNEILSKKKKFFAPDPSSGDVCTIGGMVANNSSGPHSFLYSDVKNYVIGLEGYFADGTFFSTMKDIGLDGIYEKISVMRQQLLLEKPDSEKNSSGYNLWDSGIIGEKDFDIIPLLVGSEGTLAVITKIKLKTTELYQFRGTLLVLFKSIDDALQATSITRLITGVSAIELIDDDLVRVTRELVPELKSILTEDVNAGLIIEIDGERDFVFRCVNVIKKKLSHLSVNALTGMGDKEREKLWYVRKAASPILNKPENGFRSMRIIEDFCISFDKISEFYREQKKILSEYGFKTAFFGHIGSGHFHINPKMDTANKNFVEQIMEVSKKSYELVHHLNGSFTGEHGDGIFRSYFIKKIKPDFFETLKKIKELFDPDYILNPGKIVMRDEDEKYFMQNLRFKKERTVCDGCNACVNFCKSFLARKGNHEGYKTRGRAYLVSEIKNNNLHGSDLKEALLYLNDCRACKRCATQCPLQIDMDGLLTTMRENKQIPCSWLRRFFKT